MKLPVQLAKSKRIKTQYLHLFRRSFTAEPDTSQRPSISKKSIVTEAADLLLQTPEDEWDSSSQLKELLFPSTSHSPRDFFRITRRFPSSSQALSFFNFLKSNTPDEEDPTLSSTFQAVLEMTAGEPNSPNNLFELYKTCQERKIHLTVNAVTLLIRSLWKTGMVNELMLVYSELEEAARTTHIRNVYMQVLLRGGRVGDAFKVLDKMLEKDSDFPPNAYTGDVIFYWLIKKRPDGREVSNEEMIDLVSRFCEHGVFPNSVFLSQMITRLFRTGQGSQAWDLLHKLMKSGADLETSSCNALLSGLGREGDFKRINQLMVEMKENKIQPDVFTFGIIINRLCK